LLRTGYDEGKHMAAKKSPAKKTVKSSTKTGAKESWYVALLRGINVGTAKRISMAELRSLVEGLGFTNVRTLLNSGNVVFSGNAKSSNEVAAKIEKELVSKLGISSRITVLTGDEIATIVKENPLLNVADNHSRLLVAVITNPDEIAKLKPLTKQDWGKEAIAIGKRVIYQWCPDGVLDSPLAKASGRLLGHGVTSRNWATITKLNAIIEENK
jgi:uncharacterized protein (DUF1697 family)